MTAESKMELRGELQEAIAKVRHQVEIQSTANHYVGSEEITEEALSELRSELAQLESALAGLK